jgi:hypothetical protein
MLMPQPQFQSSAHAVASVGNLQIQHSFLWQKIDAKMRGLF